jgi:hypothetical protein
LNLPITLAQQNAAFVVTFYPEGFHRPELISLGNLEYEFKSKEEDEVWETVMLAVSSGAAATAMKKNDPSINKIGD